MDEQNIVTLPIPTKETRGEEANNKMKDTLKENKPNGRKRNN